MPRLSTPKETVNHVDLTAELQREGDAVVVSFTGDVDALSAPKLRDSLAKVMAAGHTHLVCDLTNVGFLDSTGLGVLVGRLKALRMADGDMRLVINSEKMRRNFKITGLDTIFAIDDSRDDALRALRSQPSA